MPIGIYDHSKNKGFSGKKHTKTSRWLISEGNIRAHARRQGLECKCRGHKEEISTNDCMCSPHDARDLQACKRYDE